MHRKGILHMCAVRLAVFGMLISGLLVPANGAELERIHYNHPGLVVDLGVGLWAWPLPMDFDSDGDNDLVVACPDVPYKGIYLFENTQGNIKMPVFKPAVRVGQGSSNLQVSYVDGAARILAPGEELVDFKANEFAKRTRIYKASNIHDTKGRVRANQWKYCDYDGDGALDLVIGVEDWADYGWDNAFDSAGKWKNGPLHGVVYWVHNSGTTTKPQYAAPVRVEAGGKPIDTFGMPSPNLADFDGDGDLDLVCGEFLDKLTYFQNTGTRTRPQYAAGRLLSHNGQPITMDLEMIVPVALDWDKDGDVDLVVGQEDGRVALIEHTGKVSDGMPQFLPPVFFQQQADEVKFGALVAPVSVDWDGDGDADLICGNTAGYVGFIENLDGGNPPKWAAPKCLDADGEIIRIMAGENGSIQGPCEAKWGYTNLNVADWDHDGLPDVIVNSIWGKVVWYRNIGSRRAPKLAAEQPIEVEWTGPPPKPAWNWWSPQSKELVTQWRTTPVVIDLTGDGLNDLVMLDHEGYLALFERVKRDNRLALLPGKRVFKALGPSVFDSIHNPVNKEAGLLRLNNGEAGKSGRRTLCFTDWDCDGKLDLLVNSKNVNWMKNISEKPDAWLFQDMGMVAKQVLAGHSTTPTTVDWDKSGIPDLLIGAEDGYLYYLANPSQSR
ncbi:MAG: VCBS repeat-containing protein [Candidatus Sumerlaeia bacterium]|nr:VCBS repeat-containing protein [Candidatus Sumerlaeia bacterium]